MGRSRKFRTTGRSLATRLLQHSIPSFDSGCRLAPNAVSWRSPENGGVLVSTEGLRTGLHAEDDSLAS
jgi:hypothetical protein